MDSCFRALVSGKTSNAIELVIPAQAGIQQAIVSLMDPRFRGDDGKRQRAHNPLRMFLPTTICSFSPFSRVPIFSGHQCACTGGMGLVVKVAPGQPSGACAPCRPMEWRAGFPLRAINACLTSGAHAGGMAVSDHLRRAQAARRKPAASAACACWPWQGNGLELPAPFA